MKIYLAACFEQQAEVRTKANQLANLGIECVSRWRFEEGNNTMGNAECARMDLEDIRAADMFVVLTDQTSPSGGKHVETGYAIALGKPVMIVGRKENVFHNLPQIMQMETWADALSRLEEEAVLFA